MAKDPAFLFYPGDYLRDTQCLSQNTQVAYDRIMCEHMRNICITQDQLNFFTKRLSEDEKSELLMILIKKDCGYQIEWVAESILKRKDYSDSRRKNRTSKSNNIYKSYDEHMVNENENENKEENKNKKRVVKKIFISPTFEEFKEYCKQEGYLGIAERAFKGYDVADWHDAKGAKIINWKQKLQNGWFKSENLSPELKKQSDQPKIAYPKSLSKEDLF